MSRLLNCESAIVVHEHGTERRYAVCGDALTDRTDRVTCSPRCRVALMRRRKRNRLSRLADG